MRVIKKLMLSMMAFILLCFTWPVLPIHAAGQMVFEGVPSVEMRPETEGNQLVKPDVAKVVCSDPTTEASSPSCPVIKWGDLTYWIYSDKDNNFVFYVAVYNQKGALINHKIFSGARYIKEITVDGSSERVTLKGQGNQIVQVTFDQLKEITYTPGVDLSVTDSKVGMNETVNLIVNMRSPIEDLDGDIVFKSSGSTLTQVELADGKAEYSLDSSTLGLGVHTFTADYIPKLGSEFKMNTSKPVTIEVAYRVNFMDGQGNVFSKNIVRDGGLAQEPNPSPTRAGHTFAGWYTDQTDPTTKWNFGSNTVARNMALFAHWTVNNYTVTYDANYSGAGTATTETVAYGAKASEPNPAPTRESYTFAGWYTDPTDPATLWNFSSNTVTGNMTLYAHWTVNNYTVTYDANYSGAGTATTETVAYGAKASEPNPAPTREGYTFAGWYTDATDPATQWNFSSNTVTGNMTLYAHWTVNNYTVTYDANYSGAGTATTETVAYGAKASEPNPAPTRAGYTFAGWYTDATDPTFKWNFASDVVEGDVTLYAHWTVKITPQPPTPSTPSPSVPSAPSVPVVVPSNGEQSQSTVLINGQAVSTRRVDETLANGQPVVRLILTAQGLTNVMNTNASEAKIVIDGLGTAVKLEIPMQPLQVKVKADANAKLQITVNGNSVSIPLNSLADRQSDSALTISIVEGSKEAQARVERVAQTMDARVVLKQPVTLSVDINGQDTEDGSNDYLHKSIVIPAGFNPDQITVVRIDANGQLHFVPAVFTATQAEILSTQGGEYTIISMNKVFNDVQQHWAGEDIQQMANKLIVDGRPDGSFAPEQPITRAEFTAMLVRAMGLSGGSVKTELPSAFNDVDSEQWYANALITAGSKGLVNGFADGSFHPDGQITREQMATMLDRALNLMKIPNDQLTGTTPSFTDASNISNWSSDAVARLVETGIVKGMNGGTFAPQENATRAQSTVMLMRLMRFAQLIN
ncbi:InlB B-repeat-containing protein [Paenibacillus amylolyticus]|uniref:InlB B-repeat-containing protein n=1 Tax=Paenibacillus amylolyticus TaxID=1451 RepID=UPI00201D88E7|nr:InlB B-repeat-containing protein [Paenibacillus amylolyticus]MCL6664217.1 InlB B-repeat-containing protein [Paenibacillus amylolyticus]